MKLTNNTGQWLQIDSVQAAVGTPAVWTEAAVYKNLFQVYQTAPGTGEVAAVFGRAEETYSPLKWRDASTDYGLSVEPGAFIQINSGSSGPSQAPTLYVVTTAAQTLGVLAARQPKADATIPCNGLVQNTLWDTWQNTSGANWYIGGATIYAASGATGTIVTDACVYIRDSSDTTTIWSHCGDAVRTRGTLSFPIQTVAPGQRLAAQAINQCSPGALWDWAAFIWFW